MFNTKSCDAIYSSRRYAQLKSNRERKPHAIHVNGNLQSSMQLACCSRSGYNKAHVDTTAPYGTVCSFFFKKEMELSLIGLQNAGKTSLVNVITSNDFHEDMIPTVGFNMRKVTKGSVTIKLWDLGGQVCRSFCI